MSDQILHACAYLQQRSHDDEDVRMLIRSVCIGHLVPNVGRLAEANPDAIMVLYDAVKDMEVDLGAMAASDDAVDEVWRSKRARQAQPPAG